MNFQSKGESATVVQDLPNRAQFVKPQLLPGESARLATQSGNFAYCQCSPGYFCKLQCVHEERKIDIASGEDVWL